MVTEEQTQGLAPKEFASPTSTREGLIGLAEKAVGGGEGGGAVRALLAPWARTNHS